MKKMLALVLVVAILPCLVEGVYKYTSSQTFDLSDFFKEENLEELPPLTAQLMKELPEEVSFEYMMQNYDFFPDICERWKEENIAMHCGPGIMMSKKDLLLEVYIEETRFGYVYEN